MSIATFSRTLPTSLLRGRHRAARRRGARRQGFRPAFDRLESRVALAVDTLSIGGLQAASFTDATGDFVTVSITGSAGTAVFRDAGGGIVDNSEDIATVSIIGASPDFQLTFGASRILTGGVGPLNGVDTVALGRITADSVIRGINTVASDTIVGNGGPTAAIADPITFTLVSFAGVNFSKGGGLFVDVVTGDVEDNLGILLVDGFSPYATIAIREQLDAVIVLGARNGAKADGRLLIESATSDSRIFVNNSGDTSANSKLEILGGEGPFDAGVGFRGGFSGTVNLQSAAGGSWVFERGVGPTAVLTARSWDGLSEDAPVTFPGVAVFGDFAGALNSTAPLTSDISTAYVVDGVGLSVRGNVKGTARVNSAGGLQMFVEGSVLKGAQFNAVGPCQVQVGGNFSGAVSAGNDVFAFIQGNVSGAKFVSSFDVRLMVGLVPTIEAVDGQVRVRSCTNSSVVAAGDIDLSVSGDVVRSSFVGRNIVFSGLLTTGEVTNIALPPVFGILGSVSNSTFTAGGGLDGVVGGNVASSVVQAQVGMEVAILGGVSKSRFVTTEGELAVSTERDFQGTIQGGSADVGLFVEGSVLKGSSLLTGGDAEVDVARTFAGVVDVDQLQFYVGGNVARDSRIVARQVWDWQNEDLGQQFHDGLVEGQNFFIGGRFDGILNVGVFDACDGDAAVTIIGGGAGTSARFYVGRFETDLIIFAGDFRGNIRVLQDLVAVLAFAGNVDRITIGGQVLANIGVQGRLLYLISNSYFSPDLPGRQTGRFLNGSFQPTGNLTTGSYVTVLPFVPPPV